MLNKEIIEKKLVEFEELVKEMRATKKNNLKMLKKLEEEIRKDIKEYLKSTNNEDVFEFVADISRRIMLAKKSLYN